MLHSWYSEKAPYSCRILPPPVVHSYDHCLTQATELHSYTATFMGRSWTHILFQAHECLYWQSELAWLLGFDLPSIPHITLLPAPYFMGSSIGVLLEQLSYHRLGTSNLIHSKIHCVSYVKKKPKQNTPPAKINKQKNPQKTPPQQKPF